MNAKALGILLGVGVALGGIAYFVRVKAEDYSEGVMASDSSAGAAEEIGTKVPLRKGFSYDLVGSRKKLESLGRVFVAARKKGKTIPPDQWNTPQDAGLKASLFDYDFIVRNAPYDPTPEQRDRLIQNLYVTSRSPKPMRDKSGKVVDGTLSAADNKYSDRPAGNLPDVRYPDFTMLAWPDVLKPEQINAGIKRRGEMMPVLLDTNMWSPEELAAKVPRMVLVLRLNGQVDEIEAIPTDYLHILMNK